MPDTTIENPVINSAFREPARHFRFGEDGITNEIVEARRASSYFIPIPPPKKKLGGQLELPQDWTADRIKTNETINRIRESVSVWRSSHYPGITRVTRDLSGSDPRRRSHVRSCTTSRLAISRWCRGPTGASRSRRRQVIPRLL